MSLIFSFIQDEKGKKTKHQQIVDGIIQAVAEKELQEGYRLPSINMFLKKLPVARMTVVKAMEELKKLGIIALIQMFSIFGKTIQLWQS